MNGHAFLKLRKPKKDNIQNLYFEKYEISYCEYTLRKSINERGEINGDISGGNIRVVLPMLPNDNIMSWVLDASKKYNGEITLNDAFRESLEKIYFEEGRPIAFRLQYEPGASSHVTLHLTINAQKLVIGETEHQ